MKKFQLYPMRVGQQPAKQIHVDLLSSWGNVLGYAAKGGVTQLTYTPGTDTPFTFCTPEGKPRSECKDVAPPPAALHTPLKRCLLVPISHYGRFLYWLNLALTTYFKVRRYALVEVVMGEEVTCWRLDYSNEVLVFELIESRKSAKQHTAAENQDSYQDSQEAKNH